MRSYFLTGTELQFCKMKSVQRWVKVMAVQHCKVFGATQLSISYYVHFTIIIEKKRKKSIG